MGVEIPMEQLMAALRKAIRWCPRDFFITAHGPRGIGVELRSSGSSGTCPFGGYIGGDPSSPGSRLFQFTTVGAINGSIPTNMFGGDGKVISLTLSGATIEYVQIHALTDGLGITSCTLITSATPAGQPDIQEEVAPPEFFFDLYVIANGSTLFKVVQCGNLGASPELVLETDKADPICAGDPHVKHYTWKIQAIV